MFISSEKKILDIIKYSPPIFIIITSILILTLLYFEHQTILKHEIEKIKEDFILEKKNEVEYQVDVVKKYINNSKKQAKTKNLKALQKRIIEDIRKFEYRQDRYIFIIDYDSKVLVHINDTILDKNLLASDGPEKRKNEIRDIIKLAKEGGGFITYTQFQKPTTKELVDKTSYVIGLDDWKWLIGTGFYHDNMENEILIKKKSLEAYYSQQLYQTTLITIGSAILLLILSFYFSKIVRGRFDDYKNEINKNIQEKDEYTKLLNQQAKMASIGEMIGNIAHQWRQPLTVISMSSNNMKMDIALEEIDLEEFDKHLNEISAQTNYLSNTIEDFRNFFKQTNEITTFSLKEALDKALSLISTQFKNRDIQISTEVKDIKIKGVYNEFIQVLINILNNSKDAFGEKKVEGEKYIFISSRVNQFVELTIYDNAGGIDKEVIENMYEPYVTTKHQSQGTGIGLYMSNEIISKHMEGEIISRNITFTHKKKSHKGALTLIILPLCGDEE